MASSDVPTQVEIFTDGACSGNPGPGGWGAVLRCKGVEKKLSGGAPATTSNRMELTAVIKALDALIRPCQVNLYTDSQYVQKGIRDWMPGWRARGWKTSRRQPVKNQDLWQHLEAAAARHRVTWHWIRGHAGHPDNERADVLARAGLERTREQGT